MENNEFKYISSSVERTDALKKTTGELKYFSDIKFQDMLYGSFLRSKYPHALIKKIDTKKARNLEGVEAVLTYKDIPENGLNGFGIVIPDMPVFAYDKVRYTGDIIALVVAKTQDIADSGASLIEVDYEELPVVDDVFLALENKPLKVHENGNILLHTTVKKGNTDNALKGSDLIIENEYRTGMQAHVPLETESGVAKLENDGTISVYCGSQYSFRDQLQIARALGLNPSKINVYSQPLGGGFGGKDEITIQIHLALATLKTGKPVKIFLKREESFISYWKRHPFIMKYKTGFKNTGRIVANEVFIYEDKGAYASLGGPILNLAIEHASGPYKIENTHHEGWAIYTNNGVCGAFRGFGVPQVTFAMESQMDIAAEKLKINPIKIREINMLKQGDISPIGHTLMTSVSVEETLKTSKETDLWKNKEEYKKVLKPWIKRGVGLAISYQGAGLGRGIPDFGAAHIDFNRNGEFILRIGLVDMGQGTHTAFLQIAADSINAPIERFKIVAGETKGAPDSGPATASRSVYTASNVIVPAAADLIQKLKAKVKEIYKEDNFLFSRDGFIIGEKVIPYEEIGAKILNGEDYIRGEGYFTWPVADKEIEGAEGLPHFIYSYSSQIALVEINTLTGEVKLLKVATVLDSGKSVNLQGLEAQIEGGVAMGEGYTLFEDVIIEKGYFKTKNYSTYIIPTAMDIPLNEEIIIENPEDTSRIRARGIAETTMVPVIPAIANAIYDATGLRFFSLPITAEKILLALENFTGK